MSAVTNAMPSNYAQSHQGLILNRWNNRFDQVGSYVRSFAPVLFQGIPPVVGMAFTANSTSSRERTSINEIGYWQTPSTTWTRLRTNAVVRSLIHRDAVQWQDFASAIEDQAAIGLLDYRNGGRDLMRRLPDQLRSPETSVSFIWCCVMAYVLGSLQPSRTIVAANTNDPRELVEWVIAHGTKQQAYPIIRAWQRLATAKAVATELNMDTDWFVLPPTELELPLARLYIESHNSNVATEVFDEQNNTQIWPWMLGGIGAAGAIGYWLMKRNKR